MGNGAVSTDGTNVGEMDDTIEQLIQKKPNGSTSGKVYAEIPAKQNTDEASEEIKDLKSEAGKQSITKGKKKRQEVESDLSDDDDAEPVDILLQFIPYYGQGDPSNDSIVRSTLTALAVEEVDSKDQYGNSLLLLACQYRCEDLVRILLNKGADPNAVNDSGACSLHFSCYRDSASLPIAKLILKNGGNPDIAETSYGCTPLHYSASSGDIELCKLLLSYGAQIQTCDYYNYTCVDYARDAQMTDATNYLQMKLDRAKSQMQSKASFSFGSPSSPAKAKAAASDDIANWESHIDPGSGGKYYIHIVTGECLWENELKSRLEAFRQSQSSKKQQFQPKPPSKPRPQTAAKPSEEQKAHESALVSQATQARLVSFFCKHDPTRLGEIDALVIAYKGREHELLKELCAKYKIEGDSEMVAFQNKLTELRGPAVVAATPMVVNDVKYVDPLLLQDLNQEARKKYETQLEEEKAALKSRFESHLEEEKNAHRTALSEKEGTIAKLQSEIVGLQESRASLEKELKSADAKADQLQQSGGNAVSKIENDLKTAQEEVDKLKAQLAATSQELSYEREKLTSLEASMQNLTAGKEEQIAREKAAAEERASHQREREEKHAQEIAELEAKARSAEQKLKSDFNEEKAEWQRIEHGMHDEFVEAKRIRDAEIEVLRRELGELKAQYAQDMSNANMQIEDLKDKFDDANSRAAEAEHYQRLVQEEIAEAKVVQKYNAQLHKDLQREQLARRKLHNDMEDLKGRIRVYVRVRPMSEREKAKNCTESVVKDGKMTVMVKGVGGPDGKKIFDFDQIFAEPEGNTQMDVFKDTKHLIMSVIDGYNVCIFAYGQTGAGKSFTMIGAADIATCLGENGEFDELSGITPRAVSELFRLLNERTAQIEFEVEVQMFQLYRDALDDLLRDPVKRKKGEDMEKEKPPAMKITLAEHSPTGLVHIEGATVMTATTPADVMRIFAKGSSRRTTASTQMNAESSRSHLICTLTVKLKNRRTGKISTGKLTLVDLAGSERVDKSGATGEMLKEAQSINKSLSALGDVISALTTGQQHVPYRNHPLTMLMSDSIGGNAKTLMFVNTSPADYNTAESVSSLSFASRCKDVTNNVAAGPQVQAAQINALKKELAKMKKSKGAVGPPPGGLGATLGRPETSQGGRK